MHGYLRLFLALVVVFSHLGRYGGVINFGISSVAVFYMLSGYVVTQLCGKFFPPGRLKYFYAERFLRIYPLYLLLALTCAVFLFVSGYGKPQLTVANAFGNLTIVPLNYFMFWDFTVGRDLGFPLLPTAWSLALELQAYAILPLILRSELAKWITGVGSIIVWVLSAFGQLDPNLWGYRFLPGVMFIFLTGSALYKLLNHRNNRSTFDVCFPTVAFICMLGSTFYSWLLGHLDINTLSVACGIGVGIPLLLLTSKKIKLPGNALVGQMSYGVFLVHFPLMWVYSYFFGPDVLSIRCLVFVIASSLVVALIATLTVERMVWPWRKKLAAVLLHPDDANAPRAPATLVKIASLRTWENALTLRARWVLRSVVLVLAVFSVMGGVQALAGVPFKRLVKIDATAIRPAEGGIFAISLAMKQHLAGGIHYRARMLEDGVPAILATKSSDSVRRSIGGTFAASKTQIWFRSSDGTDPRSNGRSYAIVLPWVMPKWLEALCFIMLGLVLPVWLGAGFSRLGS